MNFGEHITGVKPREEVGNEMYMCCYLHISDI